jgi:prevent-host-death family protein
MRSVGVAELKASLSAYLAKVKAGEEVLVTERGKAVAKLVPLPRREGISEEILDLERRGIVRIRGRGRIPDDFWSLPRPADPDGLFLKALLEEREAGW